MLVMRWKKNPCECVRVLVGLVRQKHFLGQHFVPELLGRREIREVKLDVYGKQQK